MDRDGAAGGKAGREGSAKAGEAEQVLKFRGTRDLSKAGEQAPTETSSRQTEKPRN